MPAMMTATIEFTYTPTETIQEGELNIHRS